ncbi:MAG: DUF4870 domain-containing protein [bacterium]|nr:DUF4870 domain-containing protein [bacterium]
MPTKKSNAKKAEQKFSNEDIEKNKVVSALSYIFILCLIPLLLKQTSPYAQFHARQGLTITVAFFIFWVIGIIPILGWMVAFFGNIALIIISILGVIKTLDGKAWEIPFIYEWSKKWNL